MYISISVFGAGAIKFTRVNGTYTTITVVPVGQVSFVFTVTNGIPLVEFFFNGILQFDGPQTLDGLQKSDGSSFDTNDDFLTYMEAAYDGQNALLINP